MNYEDKLEEFVEYLDENYEQFSPEMFVCKGGHLWHISVITEEWAENMDTFDNLGGNL